MWTLEYKCNNVYFYYRTKFLRNEDIERLIHELSDEEEEGDRVDDGGDFSDGEEEFVNDSDVDHNSESEQEGDVDDDLITDISSDVEILIYF